MANLPKTHITSIVTCNKCNHTFVAEMPLIQEVHQLQCPVCKYVIKTEEGDCCVYCSHGSEDCPKMQLWEVLRRSLDNA